jgi:hypothetical protein
MAVTATHDRCQHIRADSVGLVPATTTQARSVPPDRRHTRTAFGVAGTVRWKPGHSGDDGGLRPIGPDGAPRAPGVSLVSPRAVRGHRVAQCTGRGHVFEVRTIRGLGDATTHGRRGQGMNGAKGELGQPRAR